MILLSFSSAAKYIISMMLAVLGIISYDDIQRPERPAEAPHQAYVLQELPLDQVMQMPLEAAPFIRSFEEGQKLPEFIPPRNQHTDIMRLPEQKYDIVRCAVNGEILKGEDKCNQVIIYFQEVSEQEIQSNFFFRDAGR